MSVEHDTQDRTTIIVHLKIHLLECTLTDDMSRALKHTEAEAPVQFLASNRAYKLRFIAGLEVALSCDASGLDSILILVKSVQGHTSLTYNQVSEIYGNALVSTRQQSWSVDDLSSLA